MPRLASSSASTSSAKARASSSTSAKRFCRLAVRSTISSTRSSTIRHWPNATKSRRSTGSTGSESSKRSRGHPLGCLLSVTQRRLSASLMVNEIGNQAERVLRIRRRRVPRNEGVGLAVKAVIRDRAAGLPIGGREIGGHVVGEVVVGGSLHDQSGGRLDGLAAIEEPLWAAFRHRLFGGPELVMRLDEAVVTASLNGAITGQRIRHRPAGDGKGEARISPRQRM